MKLHLDPMPVHATINPVVFQDLPAVLRAHAQAAPDTPMVVDDAGTWTRRELMDAAHRIAQRLLACGLQRGDTVALLGANRREAIALMLGTLAAGGCFVPLAASATGEVLAMMVADSDARFLFADQALLAGLPEVAQLPLAHRIVLEGGDVEGWQPLAAWVGDAPATAPDVVIAPEDAFNIIYSSGTTGRPKGIVHDHRLRAQQCGRFVAMGFDQGAQTLLATPLYSNTTMVALLPTLLGGGLLVLMAKFDAVQYLRLAEQHRITHTMLVPVQYQRLLAAPTFAQTDLSAFRLKMSAGAPLRAALIGELMTLWPGNLIEIYGMTEGGGGTVLNCAAFPDKWDSVGRAGEGTVIHVIDEAGQILPVGQAGELVGRGNTMMRGYYKQPSLSEEIIWRDAEGQVFYRTGDMARLDEDGFVYLLDRRKDMILSGGFNIYAEDLERALLTHEEVQDVAVIAVPSEAWGETPLGLVVLAEDSALTPEALLAWANARLGKTQRLSAIEVREALPRNALGKLMKRELRQAYWPD